MTAAGPLGHGSLSLGLSAVTSDGHRTAGAVVDRMVDDAALAVAAGFDGVTISEHHAGFPGYVPDPLTMAGVVRERVGRGWAVAAPTILPLRNPLLVVEQLAWGHAVHPGRVGAAFVPGYHDADFALLGLDFETRHRTHWQHFDRVVAELRRRPGAVLGADPAVAGLPDGGLPLLTGAAGPIAARRAAQLGVGMLLPSLRPPAEVRDLVQRYADHGGTGPAVMIRRLHVGGTSSGSDVNRERWASRTGDAAAWLDLSDDALSVGEPQQVLDSLLEQVEASGCTALNLRLECYADAPDLVPAQLEALGEHVVPGLRAALGGEQSTGRVSSSGA